MVHLETERFIGVLDDYSIVYLMECEHCGILIAYQGQGHNCGGVLDTEQGKKFEAAYLAQFMTGLKKIYVLKKFESEYL
jgi:hypothetical protein